MIYAKPLPWSPRHFPFNFSAIVYPISLFDCSAPEGAPSLNHLQWPRSLPREERPICNVVMYMDRTQPSSHPVSFLIITMPGLSGSCNPDMSEMVWLALLGACVAYVCWPGLSVKPQAYFQCFYRRRREEGMGSGRGHRGGGIVRENLLAQKPTVSCSRNRGKGINTDQ